MLALALIAHGSKRKASNDDVRQLALGVQQSVSSQFGWVQVGFLEIATPSIPDALNTCIQSGATSIILVPYFLTSGKHVIDDIPRIVETVARQHKNITIHIADHIGKSDILSELVICSANKIISHVQGAGVYD